MPEKKPKPYSQKRQGNKVVKGDAQKPEGISVPTKEKETKEAPKESAKTPKGKEYQVVGKAGQYWIEFKTGGQIPAELKGTFTKESIAWDFIRAYEAKRGT